MLSQSLTLLVAGAIGFVVLVFLSGIRYIPNDRVGIVEKRFSLRGSVNAGFIALGGEAGFLPDLLRGGLHYLLPFQYRVHTMPLVTIPQGRVGYVFARDGRPLGPMQTLAASPNAALFQDVRAFLNAGGQKGPQRALLREGTYAINLAEFVVITESKVYFHSLGKDEDSTFRAMASTIFERQGFAPICIKGADDQIGVVTVHDGPALPQGQIIAPIVGDDPRDLRTFHNNFQDAEAFLAAGGRRGRQLQVMVEGTYYVNRLFATVEMIPKTVVEVGNVGVVVSYTGETGSDLSGNEYKHGELVAKGHRGVWSEALLPGKYAFNAYAGKVIMVPTTNFILKWNKSEVGSHRFDENLTEVSLITKDAFEPSLPLSVVVHIDYKKAPYVVQRFGDVKRLVEQTLDPMVAAYFKNIGQTRTLIQLLQERSLIQALSSEEMKARFAHYNLELEEVLIGTPTGSEGDTHIDTILAQLRARQIAEEQVETYARQERAAIKERELREAMARAQSQAKLTASELEIQVQANEGKAAYERSQHEAMQIRCLAEAEAEKKARIGIAEAVAIEEQVRAYGGPKFQVTREVMNRFAEAIASAKVDVVPKVVVGSNGDKGTGSVQEALLSMLLSDKLGEDKAATRETSNGATDRGAIALRDRVRSGLMTSLGHDGAINVIEESPTTTRGMNGTS
jgi:uncharacterized membrane protein YqiK